MTGPARTALLLCGLVASILYSNFVLDWTNRGFVGMDDIVSQLEAPGQPHALLLRTTDVVCALLVVALLPWVRAALPRSAWREVTIATTVLFALGATIAAVVPTPCGPDVPCRGHDLQIAVHDGSSIASDAALYVGVAAAWLAVRRAGPTWFRLSAWWVFWLGGVGSSALFAWFNATDDPDWAAGVTQRAHILFISAWIVCLTVLAARGRASPPSDRAPSRPPSDRHLEPEHDRVHSERSH